MASFRTQVEVEGKKYEVEVPGVVPEADIQRDYMRKDAFESEMQRRVGKLTEGRFTLEDLKSKPELRPQIVETLGIKEALPGAQTPAELAEAVNKARREAETLITERELKPLRTQAEKDKAVIARLRETGLINDILIAAREAGVKDEFLKPVAAGQPPAIVSLLKSMFGYDEQTDAWYAREGDGFKMAPTPSKDRLHMTAAEFIAAWASEQGNSGFVKPQQQGGPKVGQQVVGSTGGANGRDIVISAEEASDSRTYAAAQERARAQGGQVRVARPQGSII